MPSFKFIFLIGCLILILTSCSKNTITGFYVHDKNVSYEEAADTRIDDYLELNKDSTFAYENFYTQYNGGDVTADYYSFIGAGSYHVQNKMLILGFDDKFKVDSLKNLKVPGRFIKPGNKIDNQVMTGTLVFPISKHRGYITIGDMVRVK